MNPDQQTGGTEIRNKLTLLKKSLLTIKKPAFEEMRIIKYMAEKSKSCCSNKKGSCENSEKPTKHKMITRHYLKQNVFDKKSMTALKL